ncbi:MAG TPA: hypothetical protein VKT28_14380 [Puia sp.]|nr:hypothetical protein [Puia sp.]
MKNILVILCLLISSVSDSQEAKSVSNQFTISGRVNHPITFSLKDAKDFQVVSLDSFVIYNHLHERKRAIKNLKGILLTDLLKKAGIDEANPKLLSEFYFTCIANDGYKVAFSWNEIFNTEVGNGIIIVTEEDGTAGESMPDRIVLLSSKDYATGRRYVKGLEKIIVERVK